MSEKEIITIEDSEVQKIDDTTTPAEVLGKPKVKTKKRKPELEKLAMENWQPPTEKQRKRNKIPKSNSSKNNTDLMPEQSKSPSPPILLHTTNIGYTLPVNNTDLMPEQSKSPSPP